MSDFMFLMQFRNVSQIAASDVSKMMLISQIGSGISLIGCVMTLSILCFLSAQGDGLYIIGNMSMVMMAAQLSFIGAENTYPKPIMCRIATYILMYFFLALHFSALAYGLHLWSRLNARCFPCRKRRLYAMLTWVLPILIVFVTSMFRGDTFATEDLCWLPSSHHTRLAFLVPVSCILLANSTIYCRIIGARFKHDYSKGKPMAKIIKNAVLSTLSVFPVLNLQWVFGYSVTFDLHSGLQYVYVVLCSSQGLFILVFHVLTTGQVKKALFAKLAEAESDFSTSANSAGGTGESIVDNACAGGNNKIRVEPKKET